MILDFGKMSDEDMKVIHEEVDPLFKLPFTRSSISESYAGAYIDSTTAFPDESRTSSTFFPNKKMVVNTLKVIKKKIRSLYGDEYAIMHTECQLLKYDVGQKFDWHYDYMEGSMPIRILTFSLNLNDGWGDGGLEVKYLDDIKNMGKEEGDFCVFFTRLKHRAVAPTLGQRKALTFWFIGEERLFDNIRDIHYEMKMEKLKEKAL